MTEVKLTILDVVKVSQQSGGSHIENNPILSYRNLSRQGLKVLKIESTVHEPIGTEIVQPEVPQNDVNQVGNHL